MGSIDVARRDPALLSSTGLPLIVAITAIGVAAGKMRPETAAALVGAGMLSVPLFPAIGIRWLRATPEPTAGGGTEEARDDKADEALPGEPAPEAGG